MLGSLLVLSWGAGQRPLSAAPLRATEVPPALRPWVPWVLRGHEAQRCPLVDGGGGGNGGNGGEDGKPSCVWAGALTLAVDGKGGRFQQEWDVLAESLVALPGDLSHWPLDVRDGGKPISVVYHDGSLVVVLAPGRHRLTGVFQWPTPPDSLGVPTDTGIVALTVNGRRIDFPRRTADGDVFLQKAAAPAESDSLQIAVHRKLTDDVPLRLTTRLALEVAGKAREVTLGKSLPAGFVPHALESQLPARIEPDGRLRVQVRPGSWTLTLVARSTAEAGKPPQTVTRPAPDGPWKEGDEVWVFEAAPPLRVVTVEGVLPIDPQQTSLPDEWKKLPAYAMPPGATLTLAQHRRGDADPPPDQLTLRRQLWLDFDGRGLTVQDSISGVFRRSWRLTMGASEKLGRVSVGGVDQFITRLPDGRDGVEIRQGRASIVAESRIETPERDFPVAGWQHDFQGLNATLALPPGWHLLHASGADEVSATWLRDWTLLQLFLVLVAALAAGKLFGMRGGVLTLFALGLSVTQPEAPQWLWLAVLLGEALARVLREGKLGTVVRLYQLGTWIALVLVAVPFAVRELRVGLFPAQEAERPPEAAIAFFTEESPASAPPPPPPPTAAYDQQPHAMGSVRAKKAVKDQETIEMERLTQNSLGGSAGAGVGIVRAPAGDGLSGISARSLSRAAASVPAPAPAPAPSPDRAQNLATYDPSMVVQTGPGLPRWNWRTVTLGWSGPVEPGQRLSLWLLSPDLSAALAFLRVVLLAVLILLLLRQSRGIFRGWFTRAAGAAAALAVLLSGAPRAAAAEFPPAELLSQLRDGLLEKPACGSECASFGRMAIEAAPDRLRLRLEASAAAPAAVALPGHRDQWVPSDVLLDGKPGPRVLGAGDGSLWLLLPPGPHQIILDGPLPPRDAVQLRLPRKPVLVTSALRGWRLAGIGEDGEIADTLQLSRESAGEAAGPNAGGAAALTTTSLPPFVVVQRTLSLGLKWQVETRVTRSTPTGAAVLLNVPLLPGEAPLGENLRVAQGSVAVTMAPGENSFSWTSALEQRPALELKAASAPSFVEAWRLDLAPIWHADVAGIPPLQMESAEARVPEWRPWPGETVTIKVTRPTGSEGQTLTVDLATLTLTPGARSSQGVLTMELRSSRGAQHVVTLPDGATLEALAVDGVQQPLRAERGRVTLPLRPGHQTATLTYRDPVGLGVLYRSRAPDLGAPATNFQLELHLPADRWLLMLGGPRLGPSVLFWSHLLVLVLVALALARSSLAPLRAHQWLLLGLGLSQLPIPAAALVAGYFLAMGVRERSAPPARGWLYDLRQLGLVVWTAVALALLFVAVKEGLLSTPDMQVAGNGSDRMVLRWFADRVGAAPPAAWVLSAPLLIYRLAMLAWALWLAVALIRWSRWAWSCFVAGGLWQPLRARRDH
ncbi:MAG TPA: hypothetical protein VMU50_05105 [Polyangia bacterium]|nr:hypothetical protein [Polyangia bacterium]